MLLTSLIRGIRAARRDDRGVALAAVLGLMVTAMLLTALVAGSVITASGYSTSARAGVQSEASAEAGIAAARAGLLNGTCAATGNGSFASATGSIPRYLATVWIPFGSGWTRGCPSTLTTQIRILSTGYAAAPGVAGNSSGNTANLEVILSPGVTPTSLYPSGPAVFAYSAGSFSNGGQLVSLDGSTPNVLVKQGDVVCDNNFQATANLVVNGGNLAIDNSCTISGNAWASGRITFGNNTNLGGNAIANGITMSGGSSVANVWSSSDLTLNGNLTIRGVAKAFSLSVTGANLQGGGYIYGPSSLGNSVSLGATVLTQSIVQGSKSNSKLVVQNPISSPTFVSDRPAPPVVPNWVDFGARAADYTSTAWTGFQVVQLGTNCDAASVKTKIASLAGQPGVLDGRTCVGTSDWGNNIDMGMTNDLAIIMPSISISGVKFTPPTAKRLWLINPDTVANQSPDCASGEGMSITNNPTFTNVNVMVYTPCSASIVAGISIQGQMFANQVTLNNHASLAYAPIGLPGYDLNYGSSTTQTGGEPARSVLTQRNVSAGN
jgi:hypothetical protein